MTSAAVLTKPLAIGLGAVRQLPTALPCLKSGVFLVAGGLPRTCSLPWHLQHPVLTIPAAERPLCGISQPHPALALLLESHVPNASTQSAGELGLVAMPASVAETSAPQGESRPTSAPVLVVDELEVRPGAGMHEVRSALRAAEVDASVPGVIASALRQPSVMESQSTTALPSSVSEAASQAQLVSCAAKKKRGQSQRQRLQAHRTAAASEATTLRIQRRKHGLSAINAALRLHQHSALRAWAQASARARQIATRHREVQDAVAQVANALRDQYRRNYLSWQLHAARKLRHVSFRAWAAIVERAEPEAGAAVGSQTTAPSEATDCPCTCALLDARGAATTWGCARHQVYAGRLLLAHRRLPDTALTPAQRDRGGSLGLRLESVLGSERRLPRVWHRPPQIAPPPGLAETADCGPPGLGPPGLVAAQQWIPKLVSDRAARGADSTPCAAAHRAPADLPIRPPGAWAQEASGTAWRSEPRRW